MPVTQGQVWTFFWLHVGVVLVATAYMAVAAGLLPRITARGTARFARRSWLALVIGLLVSIPVAVVAIVLMRVPAIAGFGVLVLLLWVLIGLLGAASIAIHLGAGAAASGPRTTTDRAIRGGLMVALTWLLPVIGWFIALPLTIITGVGCLLLGCLPGDPSEPSASAHRSQSASGGDSFALADRERGGIL